MPDVDPAARDRCEKGLRRLAAVAEAERHFRDGSLSIAEFDAADEALDEAALSLRMNSYAWAVCDEVERLRAENERLTEDLAMVRRIRDEMQDVAGAAVAAKASAYLDNENLRAENADMRAALGRLRSKIRANADHEPNLDRAEVLRWVLEQIATVTPPDRGEQGDE